MPGFLRHEPTIDELEQASEKEDARLSLEEKKALIRQIKKQYGNDAPRKLFGGQLKSGMDWSSLKFRVGNLDKLKGNY